MLLYPGGRGAEIFARALLLSRCRRHYLKGGDIMDWKKGLEFLVRLATVDEKSFAGEYASISEILEGNMPIEEPEENKEEE